MPLSHKPSAKATKRLQHQLYLARECPDPVFDISSCELTEIPSSVFSLCKVLRKEALILHTNLLSSLKGAGSFADLAELRILDLHNNRLTTLTDIDLSPLTNLQVLNLDGNRLRQLPPTLSHLSALQTLSIRGNEISSIPSELGRLVNLRSLDISKNRVSVLPKQLCNIKTLESIVVDIVQMEYPPAGVCAEGTEAMMMFLCAESGQSYVAPSSVMLNVLSKPAPALERHRSQSADESSIANTLLQYEALKEQQRQQRLLLEKQLEEDQRRQALLAAKALAEKGHLVQFVAQEHARFDQELSAARHMKDSERHKMVESLAAAEREESDLVTRLLDMNEKARKTEELLEQIERERMEVEQWYIVRQEQLDTIRRKDVFASMEEMLEHNDALGSLIKKYLSTQEDLSQKTKDLWSETDGSMESVLNAKENQRMLLIKQIMKEEALQKEAFETLQQQRDARHQRITTQIMLIEQELTELTLLELEQRQMKLDTQVNILAEKRLQLTELLMILLKEKEQRENELRARMIEMEERKLANQQDYWLAQYQRLLDTKPQSLIDNESQLEIEVVTILEAACATDYVPQFARHRISIETLLQMTHDDLTRIGVHEFGVRKEIMNAVEQFLDKKKTGSAEKSAAFDRQTSRTRIPSAPATYGDDSNRDKSPVPASVTARGLQSECVICQDAESTVLFLNCGHVCSCVKCSELVQVCPMDRSPILQKIHLVIPSDDAIG